MKRFDSLYIHVPFCARKCGYCAFYSVPDATGESRQLYLQQLTAQLRAARDRLQTVETIFIGGGSSS